MAKFGNHSTRVLMATDVAGRDIDVEALDSVVNYELPQHPEAYVHRIGRTRRVGWPRRTWARSISTTATPSSRSPSASRRWPFRD